MIKFGANKKSKFYLFHCGLSSGSFGIPVEVTGFSNPVDLAKLIRWSLWSDKSIRMYKLPDSLTTVQTLWLLF